MSLQVLDTKLWNPFLPLLNEDFSNSISYFITLVNWRFLELVFCTFLPLLNEDFLNSICTFLPSLNEDFSK